MPSCTVRLYQRRQLLIVGSVLLIGIGVLLLALGITDPDNGVTVLQHLSALESAFWPAETLRMQSTAVGVALPTRSSSHPLQLTLINVSTVFGACGAGQQPRNVTSRLWQASTQPLNPSSVPPGSVATVTFDSVPLAGGAAPTHSQLNYAWTSNQAQQVTAYCVSASSQPAGTAGSGAVSWRPNPSLGGCAIWPYTDPYSFQTTSRTPSTGILVTVMDAADPGLFLLQRFGGDPFLRLCDGPLTNFPRNMQIAGGVLIAFFTLFLLWFIVFLVRMRPEDRIETTAVKVANVQSGYGSELIPLMKNQAAIIARTSKDRVERGLVDLKEWGARHDLVVDEEAEFEKLDVVWARGVAEAELAAAKRHAEEVDNEHKRLVAEQHRQRLEENVRRVAAEKKKQQQLRDAANAAAAAEKRRIEEESRRERLLRDLRAIEDEEDAERTQSETDEARERDNHNDGFKDGAKLVALAEKFASEKGEGNSADAMQAEMQRLLEEAVDSLLKTEAVARDEITQDGIVLLIEMVEKSDALVLEWQQREADRIAAEEDAERSRKAELARIKEESSRKEKEAEDARVEQEQRDALERLEHQRQEHLTAETEAKRNAEALARRKAAKDKMKTELELRAAAADAERQRRAKEEAAANSRLVADVQRRHAMESVVNEAAQHRAAMEQAIADSLTVQSEAFIRAQQAHRDRLQAAKKLRENATVARKELEDVMTTQAGAEKQRDDDHTAYLADLDFRRNQALKGIIETRAKIDALQSQRLAKLAQGDAAAVQAIDAELDELRAALVDVEETRNGLEAAIEAENQRHLNDSAETAFLSAKNRQRLAEITEERFRADEVVEIEVDQDRRREVVDVLTSVAESAASADELRLQAERTEKEKAETDAAMVAREESHRFSEIESATHLETLEREKQMKANAEAEARNALDAKRQAKAALKSELDIKLAAEDEARLKAAVEIAEANRRLVEEAIEAERKRSSWMQERFDLLSARQKARVAELQQEAEALRSVMAAANDEEQREQAAELARAIRDKKARAEEARREAAEAQRLQEQMMEEQRRQQEEARRRADALARRREAKVRARLEAEARAAAADAARIAKAAEEAAKNAQLLDEVIQAETEKANASREKRHEQSEQERLRLEALMAEARRVEAEQRAEDAKQQHQQTAHVAATVAARKAQLEAARREAQGLADAAFAALTSRHAVTFQVDDETLLALRDDPNADADDLDGAARSANVSPSKPSAATSKAGGPIDNSVFGTLRRFGIRQRLFDASSGATSDHFFKIIARDAKTKKETWAFENTDTIRELTVTMHVTKGIEVVKKYDRINVNTLEVSFSPAGQKGVVPPNGSKATPPPQPLKRPRGTSQAGKRPGSRAATTSSFRGTVDSGSPQSKGSATVEYVGTVRPGEILPFVELAPSAASTRSGGTPASSSAYATITAETRPLSDAFVIDLLSQRAPLLSELIKAADAAAGGAASDEERLARCVKANVPFVDRTFPPNEASFDIVPSSGASGPDDATMSAASPIKTLSSTFSSTSCFARPQWYLPPNTPARLFFKLIEPGDVDVGDTIDDADLLCTLASVCEHPAIVRPIFGHPSSSTYLTAKATPTKREVDAALVAERKLGAYRVNLNINGWWESVIVDELLPASTVPLVARNREEPGELWVSLVEKAFAKVAGSYSALMDITAAAAFEAVTGFPARDFNDAVLAAASATQPSGTTGTPEAVKAFFDQLVEWDRQGFIVSLQSPHSEAAIPASCPATTQAAYEAAGFVFARSFAVFKVVDVPPSALQGTALAATPFGKEGLRLCNIRHPFRDGKEWQGSWSDGDPRWRECPKIAAACGVQLSQMIATDGSFWMEVGEMVKYFVGGTVCFMKRRHFDYRVRLPTAPPTLANAVRTVVLVTVTQPVELMLTASNAARRHNLQDSIHQSPTGRPPASSSSQSFTLGASSSPSLLVLATPNVTTSRSAQKAPLVDYTVRTIRLDPYYVVRLQPSPRKQSRLVPYILTLADDANESVILGLLANGPVGRNYVCQFATMPADVAAAFVNAASIAVEGNSNNNANSSGAFSAFVAGGGTVHLEPFALVPTQLPYQWKTQGTAAGCATDEQVVCQ